ncbi:hypothetical protein CAC42_7775 [Sphaceloma murrayae]|uniref:Uncharacterized protein n=1 Tax=Sphaceloma murrayae TaxID=2082308 RepID=A0A2K1QXM7_9PEZI|nr:hypothetical protein CAC42_7775 [Sphaceloma murrayae]
MPPEDVAGLLVEIEAEPFLRYSAEYHIVVELTKLMYQSWPKRYPEGWTEAQVQEKQRRLKRRRREILDAFMDTMRQHTQGLEVEARLHEKWAREGVPVVENYRSQARARRERKVCEALRHSTILRLADTELMLHHCPSRALPTLSGLCRTATEGNLEVVTGNGDAVETTGLM